MNYFEVRVSPDGSEDSVDAYWLCIKAVREPSLKEAEGFLTLDKNARVIDVVPIDEVDALVGYNFDSETDWPIFDANTI